MSDRQHLPPEPCEPPTAAPPKPADARRSVTAATSSEAVSAKASPSYPATPVDCLLSDLISIAEQSGDEAMYEDFVERLKQWLLEKEQFLAAVALPDEPRRLIERIAPLAERAEKGPLSFADVNRLHALVLDFAFAVRKVTA